MRRSPAGARSAPSARASSAAAGRSASSRARSSSIVLSACRIAPRSPRACSNGALAPGAVGEERLVIEQLLALLHPALDDPTHVLLVADDVRREDEDEIGLLLRVVGVAEERAEERDVAEDRDLHRLVGDLVRDEPADDGRLLIVHRERRRRAALGERERAERPLWDAGRVGDGLDDVEANVVRLVQVRGDLDLRSERLVVRAPRARCRGATTPRSSRWFRPRGTRARRTRGSSAGATG